MREHALNHLPSLKAAEQEAPRINKYLRAERLATIEVRAGEAGELPKNALKGKYFAAWLVPTLSMRSRPTRTRRAVGQEGPPQQHGSAVASKAPLTALHLRPEGEHQHCELCRPEQAEHQVGP
jgi:hypothetical protein